MYGAKAPSGQQLQRFSNVAQNVSALRWASSLETLMWEAVHWSAAVWYLQSFTQQSILQFVFRSCFYPPLLDYGE